MHSTALKYHPDRNPGKEVEFNSRFQTLQAAHEVLGDPLQRAKYDADRIRAGLFSSYSSPTKPDMPPRSPNVNFPPPPRRAPPPATSASKPPPFPATPSAGTGRYAPYAQTQTERNTWTNSREDTQARTNAFEAWKHMRHGTNLPPRGVPPRSQRSPQRPAKAFASQNARETGNEVPKMSTPKARSGWDQFQEPRGGFPGISRSNTTRVPKTGGFAPATPGGDEPPARNTSAYFNVSRGERPPTSRSHTHVPPPPPGPAPPTKKTESLRPDPLKPFKSHSGGEDPFANSDRLSTPYATAGGEKTYFSSNGIHRAASTREKNQYGEWPAGRFVPTKSNDPSPTTTGRHHSASPKMRSPNPRMSFSSSSSSSDESIGKDSKPNLYASVRNTEQEPRTNSRGHIDGHRRPSLNPPFKVNSTDSEGISGTRLYARSSWNNSSGLNDSQRRSPASEESSRRASSDLPEGFLHHRMKGETERKPQPPNLQAEVPKKPQSSLWENQSPQRPLEKSRSWHEKYGPGENGNNRRKFERPATGDPKEQNPMYDSSNSDPSFLIPPSSDGSECKPLLIFETSTFSSVSWPYWAIPSIVTPSKIQTLSKCNIRLSFHFDSKTISSRVNNANSAAPNSFTVPKADNGATSAPPLRSHSSDTIDTAFSSSSWHGKFTGNAEDNLGAKPSKASTTQSRRTSPTRAKINGQTNRIHQERYIPNGLDTENGAAQMPPPPPPPPMTIPVPPTAPTEVKFAQAEWAQHFKDGAWAFPPPPPAPSPSVRAASLKRPKTPLRGSKISAKRPTAPKPASVSAAVDDMGDELASNATESTLEGRNSPSSHSSNAMDIDPDLTPPSATEQRSSAVETTGGATNEASGAGPSERTNVGHNDIEAPHLNLGSLNNVAPLAPSNTGLKDLNDLSTNLPFESRPAANKIEATNEGRIADEMRASQRFPLPNPPKAPVVPEKLTQGKFDRYVAYMRTYMVEWNAYNTRMLAHFNERQVEVTEKLGGDWISSIGGDGYVRYMRGIEEDFRVRAHWDVSWEKHRKCMEGLGEVRTRAITSKVSD